MFKIVEMKHCLQEINTPSELFGKIMESVLNVMKQDNTYQLYKL